MNPKTIRTYFRFFFIWVRVRWLLLCEVFVLVSNPLPFVLRHVIDSKIFETCSHFFTFSIFSFLFCFFLFLFFGFVLDSLHLRDASVLRVCGSFISNWMTLQNVTELNAIHLRRNFNNVRSKSNEVSEAKLKPWMLLMCASQKANFSVKIHDRQCSNDSLVATSRFDSVGWWNFDSNERRDILVLPTISFRLCFGCRKWRRA